MAAITGIVKAFFAAANALFVILNIDKELVVDEAVSTKISEWFSLVVNG